MRFFIFLSIFVINFNLFISGSTNDNNNVLKEIDILYEKIVKINENKEKIMHLENKLRTLKFDKNLTIWNFFQRNKKERVLQEKNLLLKKIINLNKENKSLSDEIFEHRKVFMKNIEKYVENQKFLEILNFIDELQLNEILDFEFLKKFEILKDKKFLRQRFEVQAKKLHEAYKFSEYLNKKIVILKKHNLEYADTKKMREKLNNFIKIGKKSQKILKVLIK